VLLIHRKNVTEPDTATGANRGDGMMKPIREPDKFPEAPGPEATGNDVLR